MSGFCLDVDEQILVKMQVRDLLRCKSLCKSWHSLISSDRFVKSHINNILRNRATGNTRITALTSTSMCVTKCKIDRSVESYVVGSSNGLVCIVRNNSFLVINPSTREVKQLGDLKKCTEPGTGTAVGFGYDLSTNDYKVVAGFRNIGSESYVFEVLTLKSNTWRSVFIDSGYSHMFGNGILCNGAIHWIAYRNMEKVIVSFDLSKEVFKEIPQPKMGQYVWKLGTMKDCLCIFPKNFRIMKDIEIWVMRRYNVQESWEIELPPPGYNTKKVMMHYTPQVDSLDNNRHIDIWMLEDGYCAPVLLRTIERLDNNHSLIRLYTYPECNYNFDEHVFVKSLVSPHGNEERVKSREQSKAFLFHDAV